MSDLLSAADDLDILIEPDEPEILIEPDDEAPEPSAEAAVSQALVEILPADFPLPLLTKFVPDPALRAAAETAAREALSITVSGPEGLQHADSALTTVRATVKAISAHFEDPTSTAYALHKRLTTVRGEWTAEAEQAVNLVGQRIFSEQRRLEAIAAEDRRLAQAQEDRKAREAARRDAEAAARAHSPAQVVEELQRHAESVTAPPVAPPASAPPALKGTTVISTWRARLKGTPDEAQPKVEEFSPAQRMAFLDYLRAVVDGRAPLNGCECNWSYFNKRAVADKATFQITGFEAVECGGARAKATRTR